MKQSNKFLNFLRDIMIMIAIYIVINVVFVQFLMRPFKVEGSSMYPTLESKEIGFSDVLSIKRHKIERFDVVIVFKEDTSNYLVKRVIGLPGETVRYEYDTLYINNEAVEEPFLDDAFVKESTDNGNIDFTADISPITLADDEYYLLGDNRLKSSDSRVYGPFKQDQIKSKNGFILFPFNKIRSVKER